MAPPDSGRGGTVGGRIRSARRAADLRQADLAKAVGVRTSAVSDWERGKHTPSDGNLADVARALGTTPGALKYGEGERPGDVSAPILSGGGRDELPPEVAKAARQLVDAFKREAALAGATAADLHYIEAVLMTPNLPPTLFGGRVPPDRFLQHIQGMMGVLRETMREAGLPL